MIHTTIRAVRFGNIILLIAVTLLCAPAAAFAASEKLTEAEKLYQGGEWEKARQIYSSVLAEQGPANQTPAFFYNLGTVSLRAGNSGEGYAYLLKSLASRPLDGDTWHNLRLAETKLSGGARSVRPESWLGFWPVPAHFFPAQAWLLPLLTASAVLLWSVVSRKPRSRTYALAALTVVALVLAIIGIQQSSSSAAVFLKGGQVKSGPGSSFPDLVNLDSGSIVNTEETRDGWKKIRFLGANQQEAVGWIEAGALLELR